MKTPKYQIGQKVWRISDDEFVREKITDIKQFYRPHFKEKRYQYFLGTDPNWMCEEGIFPDKKSLIDSL